MRSYPPQKEKELKLYKWKKGIFGKGTFPDFVGEKYSGGMPPMWEEAASLLLVFLLGGRGGMARGHAS